MAAILCTVTPINAVADEDGPHVGADGKTFFATIFVDGTYDQADRPQLVHGSAKDLLKVAGIKYVKAIEWFCMAASAVTGNTTDTGLYFAKWLVPSQRLQIFRTGIIGTGPIDQAEIGTGAAITGANQLFFTCKILGD